MTERDRLIELIEREIDVKNAGINAEWLADYLLANGVIVPPVKVSDTVYYIIDGFIEPCTVKIIFLSDYTDKDGNCSHMAEIHFDREDCPYVSTGIYFTGIGKTVFLTRKEAEKALKERKDDN